MVFKKVSISAILVVFILLAGFYLRQFNLSFGLPHSFYADEPEFSELAIKYTYEFKSIIANSDWYKLIPISYVYGTFPTYLLTLSLMLFSKTLNLIHFSFDKTTMFIFLRFVTLLINFFIIPVTVMLYRSLFPQDKKYSVGFFASLFLIALNWKFIVHAHYVNADIFLVLENLMASYFLIRYYRDGNRKFGYIAGIIFGLAIGTKITSLIILPVILVIFWHKKSLYGFLTFCFCALATFIITNPFSLIFLGDFSSRIYSMLSKEGGMVFDSVDYSYVKYFSALGYMVTWPIFIAFLAGALSIIKKLDKNPHLFILGQIIIYLVFFSIQSRRVDRWLLPILPFVFIYAAYFIEKVVESFQKQKFSVLKITLVLIPLTIIYLYYPYLLTQEFQPNTPKSAAYIWAKQNIPETATKLAYTEEGLDPLNKLSSDFGRATIIQFQVYESDGAQLFLPENPALYDYVIVSSRPMENFKRPPVKAKYPNYTQAWENFENTLNDKNQFELIKDFVLPKPNLIPLSDVFIYRRIGPRYLSDGLQQQDLTDNL